MLLELGVVIGDTKAEKEAFLEKEFAEADADGGGTVDYDEFVSFCTSAGLNPLRCLRPRSDADPQPHPST